ncbi:hypothetical protein [Metallibacterium sp.]|uniref:hypothetical protein n=1 Tax=Metallibacterium sp. TaxID=2940281 RepID=UPI00262EEE94|nr:hypothetical protein [Metallibacterium sp.]
MNAPGQQLDLFATAAGGTADPAAPAPGLVPIADVLLGAAHPACGCVRGYTRRVEPHVGIYCAGHGRWLGWLDAAGRERAKRANETEAEVRHGY